MVILECWTSWFKLLEGGNDAGRFVSLLDLAAPSRTLPSFFQAVSSLIQPQVGLTSLLMTLHSLFPSCRLMDSAHVRIPGLFPTPQENRDFSEHLRLSLETIAIRRRWCGRGKHNAGAF